MAAGTSTVTAQIATVEFYRLSMLGILEILGKP